MVGMGSSEKTEYCAFTKAVEHLGDRWSLLIARELFQFGPQGFNTLAAGLPGHISRSVLMRKLRKLEMLGLIAHDPAASGRSAPYRLAPAGEQLVPTLKSLWEWAEHWVPEDPAVAQQDPAVILWWLRHRVDPRSLPELQVAVEFNLDHDDARRQWLLLAAGADPELCLNDPAIGDDRYVFVEAAGGDLLPIARGNRSWAEAVADRSVRLFGNPDLVTRLPGWFLPVERRSDADRSVGPGHGRSDPRRIAARRRATPRETSDQPEASAQRAEPGVGAGG
jgi:DNA-binding HxlR family transcriptional regulator